MQKNSPSEFDAYSKSYGDAVNRSIAFSGLKIDYFTRVKVDYLVDLIELTRPPAWRVELLDIGCGIGNSHPLLSRRVAKVTGVDVSRKCIEEAQSQNPENDYRAYDGGHLPFDAMSFDVASAVCVFHHIPVAQRVQLARDARRVLRDKGLFAVFEHNPFNLLTRYVVNKCEFDKDAILLRSRETEALLAESGFEDVVTRFILTIPTQGKTTSKIDRLFGRLPLGAQYLTVGRRLG